MIQRIKYYLGIISWKILKSLGITPKLISKTILRPELSKSNIDLLERMKEDNRKSPLPYNATEIWTNLGNMFEDWFYWEGINNVEEQKMNGWFSSPSPRDAKLLRYSCWMLYQNVKSRDKYGLLDKVTAGSEIETGLSFEFEGKRISWDILISLDTLYAIAEVDNSIFTDSVVVADIGAGWGRIGYVLMLANPKAKYVILDLPQVLLVSSVYLPKRLPNKSFLTYEESRSIKTFNKASFNNKDAAFLGTFDLDKFDDKSIDFVINVASFQEMTEEQVELYFNKIDQKLKGIFYTQQLWKSTTHLYNVGEISGYEKFPFRPTWIKKSLKSATWSDLYFETTFEIK